MVPLLAAVLVVRGGVRAAGGGGNSAAAAASGVGIVTCDASDPRQSWKPLSPAGSADAPPQPIKHSGGGCVSAQPCAARGAHCMLAVVPCNATDPFQLFRFNASTGVVSVPPAAAPKATDAQCWNVWGNKRQTGYAIDVYTCGSSPVPSDPDAVTLHQDKTGGMLHLHDAAGICVAVGFKPAPTPPPPAPPPPADPELDCALRKLALQVAADRLHRHASNGPSNLRSVWDSLEFGQLGASCADVPARPPAARLPVGAATPLPSDALYVDWVTGSDSFAGTVNAPLKTVEFALELSIQSTTGSPRAIVLRNGTHPLRQTLEIGPSHSGLHIGAFPGEQATLSGGVDLTLEFTPAQLEGNVAALVATLPASVPDVLFTELFVSDGSRNALNLNSLSRYTKARWPDGNPETDAGMCTTTNGCPSHATATGSCGSVPFVNGTWIEVGPPTSPRRNSWNAVSNCPSINDSSVFGPTGKCAMGKCCAGYCYDDYTALEGGSAAGRFKPPLAPSSTVTDQQIQTNCVEVTNFSPRGPRWNLTGAQRWRPVLHTFNYPLGAPWGNHMYEVTQTSLEMMAESGSVAGNLSLSDRGGWHLTAAAASAHSYFVEGVKAELTVPGEWVLEDDDAGTRKLWIIPNSTSLLKAGGTIKVSLVLAGLKRLINIRGQGTNSVQDVKIDGISFAHTAQTYVPAVGGPYEVPSDGDWSILREGALWIGGDGASKITISNSLFWRLGGNGIVLSDTAHSCTIVGNEFGFVGENGIVSVGTVVLNDGTKQTYPRSNTIEANHIHDIGLWTKQVAGYTQFLTARAHIVDNVIYNTPRAGLSECLCLSLKRSRPPHSRRVA